MFPWTAVGQRSDSIETSVSDIIELHAGHIGVLKENIEHEKRVKKCRM